MSRSLPIIFFIIVIFGLSYMKNTFVINLASREQGLLIKRYYSEEIQRLEKPLLANDMATNPRSTSVVLFHLIFAFSNSIFIFFIFRERLYQKIHWLVFLGLSCLLAITYGIYVSTGLEPIYTLSVLIKDFLQSPIYSFLFLIFAINRRVFLSANQIPSQ
jgi:hypothetical protein